MYSELETKLTPHGLIARGGFHPESDDGFADFTDHPVETVVIVGNAGPAMWAPFLATNPDLTAANPMNAHPMNDWAEAVIAPIAAGLGATPVYPWQGPPWPPFQRWSKRAETIWSSPIGMLIHPEYGLWHAYRSALLFRDRFALPAPATAARPCDTCADRPCRSACPVDAFTDDGYDVPACYAHISTPAGQDCIDLGCRARRACPVGTSYTYLPEQAAYHMGRFRDAEARRQGDG